jgi:hypothetical protein
MASVWTEELREQAKQAYLDGNPTAENSAELVKEIADNMEQSANGVRMVLIQLGVYVKKDASAGAAKPGATKKEGEGAKRVSKESQIDELKKAITDRGGELDEDILGKLTGKAAAYFTKVLAA